MRVPGKVVTVAAAAALTLLGGHRSFTRRGRREAETLFAQAARKAEGGIVAEAMLHDFPVPIQRYLRYTGVVGKQIPRTVRLRQVGRARQDARQPWMQLDSEGYYTVTPPGFVWIGTMRRAGLPLARARDRYAQGAGGMLIKVASLVTLADATGIEMDQGAQMRYLNEATLWFPAALLGENVSFEPVDDHSARVTLTDSGKGVTAVLYVDDQGRLTEFVAPRYRTVNGRHELETWSTLIAGYGAFEGLHLPVHGKGVWGLDTGDLDYIELLITDLQYDVEEPY